MSSKVFSYFVGWAGQTIVLWKHDSWTKEDFEKELRAIGRGHVRAIEVSPKEFRQIERKI